MTEQQLETLGRLADKADNYLAFASSPMPAGMRLDAAKQGLEELSEQIKALYIELSGRNPWDR